ncbi:MAG: sugar transferase, partial [Microbacteriaceae bacterium]|nr:sugar transferase [Microbacteriaceae bacterium]
MTRVSVITVVHGRHDHLVRQRAALARSIEAPSEHVVVAIDDPGVDEIVGTVSNASRVIHLE